MLADAVIGMAIFALLGVVLAKEMSQHARASHRLANLRAATWLAESTLCNLQQGHQPPAIAPSDRIEIKRLDDASQVAHQAWVRVTATHEAESADLVGLIPGDLPEAK
jgi:hypothetical protein